MLCLNSVLLIGIYHLSFIYVLNYHASVPVKEMQGKLPQHTPLNLAHIANVYNYPHMYYP